MQELITTIDELPERDRLPEISLAVSSQSRLVAIGSYHGLWLFDFDGKPVHRIETTDGFNSVRFSPRRGPHCRNNGRSYLCDRYPEQGRFSIASQYGNTLRASNTRLMHPFLPSGITLEMSNS